MTDTARVSPSDKARLSLATIVLNTNRRADTVECLESLTAQDSDVSNRVIVLDNKSHDGSVGAIRASFPRVEVMSLEMDRGYAGNNNAGIKRALGYGPDWILILNEDTVLDPRCVAELLTAGEADPAIGIVGPLVFHHDEPTVIQSAGGQLGRFWESIHIGANEVDAEQFDRIRDVDWVSGCALLVRTALIDEIGMLDERFYYYWEETEWCLRARKAGWRIVHVPGARLWHKGVRRDYKPSVDVTYYNTRNRFLMMSRHRPPGRVWVVTWWRTLRTLCSWSLRPKWRLMGAHRNAMAQGIVDFLLGRCGRRRVISPALDLGGRLAMDCRLSGRTQESKGTRREA